MKRNTINFSGFIVDLALLALALFAAVMLIRIGAAVAVETDRATTKPGFAATTSAREADAPPPAALRP